MRARRGRLAACGALAAVAAAPLALVVSASAPVAAAPDGETSPKGYIEMPLDPEGAWVLTSAPGSGRNWGTPEFVRFLALVAREWRRRHPDAPRLRIGDMSKPDGTEFPPHKTHRDGLTADLFTTPENICHVKYGDQALTLELAQLMVDLGARQILYNGELVTKEVGVAQKWPDHDDHFHVVIDPARVPRDGALLVVPAADLRDGGFVAGSALREDRTGLELRWRVVGQAKLKHARVLFDDLDEQNGVLHDSGPQRRADGYVLPLALEDGARYRWKVELTTGEETYGSGWQTLQTDLRAPGLTLGQPEDDADDLVGPPLLTWRYEKPGVPQARYAVDLDNDPSHRKIAATLGPFAGATPSHLLDHPLLKRSKRFHWRVHVWDAHGNEAVSDWRSFKTGAGFQRDNVAATPRDAGKRGRVSASALNLRAAPDGAVKLALPQGTEVRIVGEADGWWEVTAPDPQGKGEVRGFVSKRFVTLD